MPDYKRQEIKCPKTREHPHKKLLLLLGEDNISVFCKDHGWIKIELHRGGEPISFKNVTAKVTEYKNKPNFVLSPTPTVAIGEFKHRRKVIA